jgi:hypothetical protein
MYKRNKQLSAVNGIGSIFYSQSAYTAINRYPPLYSICVAGKGAAKSDGKEGEASSIDSKKMCSSFLVLVLLDFE